MAIYTISDLLYHNEEAGLTWLESNKDKIVEIAQNLNSYKGIDSEEVEKVFFELLVKSHIIYRDEFMASPSLHITQNGKYEVPDYEDYITRFFRLFPKAYRDIFKKLDPELFNSIITKPVTLSYISPANRYPKPPAAEYILPTNFIQYIYMNKTNTAHSLDATQIYLDHTKEMNVPITSHCRGLEFKTDIFDHYVLSADTNNESWNFFAPLEPLFYSLTPRQQKSYIAVAFSQLELDHKDNNGDRIDNNSLVYNMKSVLNSMKIVPTEQLLEYAKTVTFDPDAREAFDKLIKYINLDKMLGKKPEVPTRNKI